MTDTTERTTGAARDDARRRGTPAGGVAGGLRSGAPTACAGLAEVDDPRIDLMGLIVEAHLRLARALEAELEDACGIPLHWFDVLIRLRRSAEGRLTMTELAAQTLLTSGGITRLVDRLEAAGYAQRQSCPTDRRSVHVALTDLGAAKLEDAVRAHLDGLERHLMDPLDETDRTALATALRKLVGDGPICGRGS
jgi:DNA-binding MarR family transcriptional regulator